MEYGKNKLFVTRQNLIKESVKSVTKDIIDEIDKYQKEVGIIWGISVELSVNSKFNGAISYTIHTVDPNEEIVPVELLGYSPIDYLHILIGELTLNGFSVQLKGHEEREHESGDKVVYETWKARIEL